MNGTKRYAKPGERIKVIGGYSEVLCHMGLAGRPIEIELIRREYDDGATVYYSGQCYRDGRPAGAPVTYGEAGFYCEDHAAGIFYTYEADPDDEGDADPRQVQADLTAQIEAALGGADVLTITNLGL